MLKEFKQGDKALLFNSKVKLFGEGKLWSNWKGPYTIINTSPHGAITIQDDDGNIFKVNGQCLKIFLEPSHNIHFNQELDRIDLIAFDKFIWNLWKFKNNNANIFFYLLEIEKYCFIFLNKFSWLNESYALTR